MIRALFVAALISALAALSAAQPSGPQLLYPGPHREVVRGPAAYTPQAIALAAANGASTPLPLEANSRGFYRPPRLQSIRELIRRAGAIDPLGHTVLYSLPEASDARVAAAYRKLREDAVGNYQPKFVRDRFSSPEMRTAPTRTELIGMGGRNAFFAPVGVGRDPIAHLYDQTSDGADAQAYANAAKGDAETAAAAATEQRGPGELLVPPAPERAFTGEVTTGGLTPEELEQQAAAAAAAEAEGEAAGLFLEVSSSSSSSADVLSQEALFAEIDALAARSSSAKSAPVDGRVRARVDPAATGMDLTLAPMPARAASAEAAGAGAGAGAGVMMVRRLGDRLSLIEQSQQQQQEQEQLAARKQELSMLESEAALLSAQEQQAAAELARIRAAAASAKAATQRAEQEAAAFAEAEAQLAAQQEQQQQGAVPSFLSTGATVDASADATAAALDALAAQAAQEAVARHRAAAAKAAARIRAERAAAAKAAAEAAAAAKQPWWTRADKVKENAARAAAHADADAPVSLLQTTTQAQAAATWDPPAANAGSSASLLSLSTRATAYAGVPALSADVSGASTGAGAVAAPVDEDKLGVTPSSLASALGSLMETSTSTSAGSAPPVVASPPLIHDVAAAPPAAATPAAVSAELASRFVSPLLNRAPAAAPGGPIQGYHAYPPRVAGETGMDREGRGLTALKLPTAGSANPYAFTTADILYPNLRGVAGISAMPATAQQKAVPETPKKQVSESVNRAGAGAGVGAGSTIVINVQAPYPYPQQPQQQPRTTTTTTAATAIRSIYPTLGFAGGAGSGAGSAPLLHAAGPTSGVVISDNGSFGLLKV